MIKFFRRIRQQLLSENKFSKYLMYALGEIVLVVIGILIALQINNWNTQRHLNTEEQAILKILKSEFSYNQEELARNIEKASRLRSRSDSLMNLFHLPENKISPEHLIKLTLGLTGYATYDPSNGALNNLISSGQLNLIKNDSLRLVLSKWSGAVQDVKEDELRMMHYGDTYLEPIRLQYLNYRKDSRFDKNPLVLLDIPEFENIVVRMYRAADYIVENYEFLGTEIDNILGLIEREIK